jgi:hypothetical protein
VADSVRVYADLQVRFVPVDQLIPYIRNSRTHTEQQIAQVSDVPNHTAESRTGGRALFPYQNRGSRPTWPIPDGQGLISPPDP